MHHNPDYNGASTLNGIHPCIASPPLNNALISDGCIQKNTTIVPNISTASNTYNVHSCSTIYPLLPP